MQLCQTLPDVVFQHARYNGDAVSFIYEAQALTCSELNLYSNRVANGLLGNDCHAQARIAILAKDSEYTYEIFFGSTKAKTVAIPINWRLATQELLFILNDSESVVLFVGEEFIPVIEQISGELERLRKIIIISGSHATWETYTSWRDRQLGTAPELEYGSNDVVVQMYTSGTTGHPKGVQLAHYSFFRLLQGMSAQGDQWMSLNAADNFLLPLPSFHIGGLWWAIQGFIAGGRCIIMDTFVAWKALSLIQEHRISKMVLVPAMMQLMLSEPSFAAADFSSLQGCVYGGSPIAPELMHKVMRAFGCSFYQIYGLTETGNMAVCLRPEDHTQEDSHILKAAGRPFPGVHVKIIDTKGNVLPANTIGEICINSPSNMTGYWKREQATRETLVDGYIHTGDAGYLDEAGYVYVCDRIKDMIICAGENIYPAEIEAALYEHEAIAEAAVIGVPDDQWGEVVKAFVVLHQNSAVKQRELINFLRTRIADYKLPRSIAVVDSLPKTPSGKLLKRILRAPFWEGRERRVN
ncbi:MAG TPA: long-chain-fatty-acid--CoA ligase [Chitinophaga sp.]|uniref:long-chain-fatty-acid--CoA ligase n=1 Tax=Chitinophaga sp. TaxID=1869181 RepID=UPI002C134229|nr:long-chain-fatty-acid--CoA ligase [Chitinophaga sp.]HVI45041.1 long-chain-fatty-acid--CoA ligase [Chitinophaga sp.]